MPLGLTAFLLISHEGLVFWLYTARDVSVLTPDVNHAPEAAMIVKHQAASTTLQRLCVTKSVQFRASL